MSLGRRVACLAAACFFVPDAALAAAWTADPSLELTGGGDDNYGLAFDRRNRVGNVSMTGGLVASRETEAAATRLNATLVGQALRGDVHQNEWQDRLSLSQTLAAPLDSFALTARTSRDQTLQTPVSSADVIIGRGLQLDAGGDGSWEHRFTERLSASSGLTFDRRHYSRALVGARDYQDGSASLSLRYLLDERDSVNASLAHQDYRTLARDTRSFIDSLSVGGQRALSETSQASVSIGAYRNRSTVLRPVLACADQACTSLVTVTQAGHFGRWGVQYGATYSGQFTERTRLSASASRQQDPSGAGVTVLGDTLRASLEHTVSETLNGALSLTHSRSRYQGLTLQPASRLDTLSAVVSKALSPQLNLRANVDYRRAADALVQLHTHSLSASLTLRYEWQRIEAHH